MEIIFDLDGTLVDSITGINFSFNKAISEILPQKKIPNITNLVGLPIREIFRVSLNEIDLGVLQALEESFRTNYDNFGYKLCYPYPGVYGFLGQMCAAGNRCYILTNKPRKPALKILENLSLNIYISGLYTLDLGPRKFQSKAEVALEMKSVLELEESRVLLVGDSQDDAEAARVCGFDFAAVTYGYGMVHKNSKVKINYLIDRITDIKIK